jgi:L-fucose isomerase-like protein
MDSKTTSFDSAEPGKFGDILNLQRQRAARARVGLIGCGYFEYWRMYPALRQRVEHDLAQLRDRLAAELDVVYPGMVDTLDAAELAGRALAEAGVEFVIVAEGTYLPDFIVLAALEHVPHAELLLFDTQTGQCLAPTDVYEDTLRNSALIGIAQLSGTLRKSGRPYHVEVGEISEPACYQRIAHRMRARQVAQRLRSFSIGLVGQVFRGMFDLEFDRGSVRGRLGPEVITIQAEHLVELWQQVPDAEVADVARELTGRFPTRGVDADDIARSVRLGLAMRRLTDRYKLDALCFLGQHYLEKITHAPARLGASMLMERDRTMVACEGDVGGLIMMQILHELTGQAPVQMEWGQFDAQRNALFLIGHGIASPEVAHAATLTRAPEEWGFEGHGVSWEMILRPGPVTMGHFLSTPEGWQMLISRGQSLEHACLACDEIHALVQVETPVREYLATILSAGVTHHVIVAHGDAFEELQMVADAIGAQKLIV